MMKFQRHNPSTNALDRNNCVPRALCIATGVDYDHVAKVCAEAGRVFGRGMFPKSINLALQVLTGDSSTKLVPAADDGRFVSVDTYGGERKHRWVNLAPTFAQFAALNPTGRFIVLRDSHAVALSNGTYYDMAQQTCGARSRVTYWCRVA